jgi:hypothetical protein
MERRDFLKLAAAGALAAQPLAGAPRHGQGMGARAVQKSLSGRRILTFNSVIRVNQIEVTRTRNEGFDEFDRHTPANVEALRAAFAEGWPGAPMTWAFSWRALFDDRENYRRIREIIPGFHDVSCGKDPPSRSASRILRGPPRCGKLARHLTRAGHRSET